MTIFEIFMINSLFILFPILIYIIYNAYSDAPKTKKGYALELALFTSIYMLMRFGILFKRSYPVLLLSIPLLIGFLNGKIKTNIIISIVTIIFLYKTFNVNLYLLIVEYISYFIYYFICKKKNNFNSFSNAFILIRIFFITSNIIIYSNFESIYNLLFSISFSAFMYAFISHLIIYLYNKASSIIDYHSTLNELKREKEIHASLFKLTHEVKNPLAVCKGYFDMMDESNSDKDKYLKIIKDSIDRTLNIMDDFLSFTKIKCNMEDVDILLILNDVKDELEPLLTMKNIKVEFDIPDDEVYVDGDYTRLKEVLMNIYKNSIESLKDNPFIKMKASFTNKNIIIKIIDNGIGMDSYTLESMDKNFFTTKENGTGLGVPFSKEIIRMHGGSLTYKSKLNKGTTAIINLPIKSNMV